MAEGRGRTEDKRALKEADSGIMDPSRENAADIPPKKKKRGPYKSYLFEPSGSKHVPKQTLFSRMRASQVEQGLDENVAAESIIEVGVCNDQLNPDVEADLQGINDLDGPPPSVQKITSSSSLEERHEDAQLHLSFVGNSPDRNNTSREKHNSELESESESEHTLDDTQGVDDPHINLDEAQGSDEDDNANQLEGVAENNDDARKETDYVKKYYLNEKLHPNFPLSRLEVLLMILHLAIRHCHTQHFVEDQIKFVNILFGINILDISYHVFKNVFPSSSSIQRHIFCDSCEVHIGLQQEFPKELKFTKCPNCDKSIDIHSIDSGSYFITLSVKDQIENLLKRSDIKLIPKGQRSAVGICDIFDGELYKKFSQHQSLMDADALTCILNTDGVRVFENSDQGSLWPVFLHLNELPPEVRFKTENLILAGLWFGKGSPNMALYLKPVLNQLLDLSQTGVAVSQPNGSVIRRPLFAIGLSVDSVAKAKLLCQRQYNGGYSCLYCYHPNDAVSEESNAHQKHFDTRVTYASRNEKEVVQDMFEADKLEREGQLRKSSVRGFLGLSIFLMLRKLGDTSGLNPFHIVWSVVIDYLHALLEGIASDLLTLFTSVLSADQIKTVNSRLDQITLPQGISRKPRHVGGKIKYKAKEYRSFFLYFAAPCFEDLLPTRQFNNLQLFVSSLHILLSDEISSRELATARLNLKDFVTGFQSIYGLHKVTYNLHLCTHLVDIVLHMGPLWCYSNFIFESGNGLLVKLVRGTRSVINEISVKYTRLQTARLCIDSNPISNEALEFCNDVVGCRYTKGEKIDGVSLTGSHSFMSVSHEEKLLLEDANVPIVNEKVKVYHRVVRNGIVYVSKSYSKAKKTNDSCIELQNGVHATIEKILLTDNNVLKCLVRPIRIAVENFSLLESIKKMFF